MQPGEILNVGTLGTLLRRHREGRGLLQQQLATLARPAITRNTISNIERGRTRPYRHTLDALTAALALDPSEKAEIVAAWVASDSEAATSLVTRPLGLPVPGTSLVGREQELVEILSKLRSRCGC